MLRPNYTSLVIKEREETSHLIKKKKRIIVTIPRTVRPYILMTLSHAEGREVAR